MSRCLIMLSTQGASWINLDLAIDDLVGNSDRDCFTLVLIPTSLSRDPGEPSLRWKISRLVESWNRDWIFARSHCRVVALSKLLTLRNLSTPGRKQVGEAATYDYLSQSAPHHRMRSLVWSRLRQT
ncbi:hypothetical protein SO802_015680 [Lithocarpus litseifolius]|uniref:Uncharacterized protein n=1 Tax=Lithocarpus litseifolius TaxID=425828 RepID=A0AAW2CWR5_9ROSI